MAGTIHLVRHGRPLADSEVPPAQWELHPTATEDVNALWESGVLPRGHPELDPGLQWWSSTEPKALGTALALTGGPVLPTPYLGEMRRPAGPWRGDEAWRDAVGRSLTSLDEPAMPGWETGRDTRDRVHSFVRALIDGDVGPDGAGEWSIGVDSDAERPGGRDRDADRTDDRLVLVGHGTAWTLLVSALTGEESDLDAWNAMTMPDHCRLRADPASDRPGTGWRVVQPWGHWRSRLT